MIPTQLLYAEIPHAAIDPFNPFRTPSQMLITMCKSYRLLGRTPDATAAARILTFHQP